MTEIERLEAELLQVKKERQAVEKMTQAIVLLNSKKLPLQFAKYILSESDKDMLEVVAEIEQIFKNAVIEFMRPKKGETIMDLRRANELKAEMEKEFETTFAKNEPAEMRKKGGYEIDPKTDGEFINFKAYLNTQNEEFKKKKLRIYNELEKRDLADDFIKESDVKLADVIQKATISIAQEYADYMETETAKLKDMRPANDQLLEFKSIETKVKAMSNDSLKDFASKHSFGNARELDVTSVEMRSRGLQTEANSLELFAKANNTREPFKKNMAYKEIVLRAKDIDMLNSFRKTAKDLFSIYNP